MLPDNVVHVLGTLCSREVVEEEEEEGKPKPTWRYSKMAKDTSRIKWQPEAWRELEKRSQRRKQVLQPSSQSDLIDKSMQTL